MTYPLDLREIVVKLVHLGFPRLFFSDNYGMSLMTISNWVRGNVGKKRIKGSKRFSEKKLAKYVHSHPGIPLKKLGKRFGVTPSAIYYAMKRLGIERVPAR